MKWTTAESDLLAQAAAALALERAGRPGDYRRYLEDTFLAAMELGLERAPEPAPDRTPA